MHRLKDKLGTRALPTAELSLEGTPARLVGGVGEGVRKIAALLNITRAYNACCAAASMRRGVALGATTPASAGRLASFWRSSRYTRKRLPTLKWSSKPPFTWSSA